MNPETTEIILYRPDDGTTNRQSVIEKAMDAYKKYRKRIAEEPARAELDYLENLKQPGFPEKIITRFLLNVMISICFKRIACHFMVIFVRHITMEKTASTLLKPYDIIVFFKNHGHGFRESRKQAQKKLQGKNGGGA